MKKIKVYKEIQSTCPNALQREIEFLIRQGWETVNEMYIDKGIGLNNKKYKMTVIKLKKEILC